MFPLFRQLRQSLLRNKKVSKYLLYAIGEIVLVVIGILLAIQVDRWNERRKLHEEEYSILNQLLTEFVENQKKLDSVYGAHKEVNRCLRALLAATGPNPDPIPLDSMDYYMLEFSHIPMYKPKTGSVTSLMSTGKLVLISNDTLRLMISTWPQQLEEYKYEAGINYDLYNFQISSYLTEKYHYRNTEIDAGKGSVGRSLFPGDPLKLLADPELENLAELKRVDSEALELDALKLLRTQKTILNMIRKELKASD
ncbi:MAG: DUF6090 family protein [Robiginitalea sp.]